MSTMDPQDEMISETKLEEAAPLATASETVLPTSLPAAAATSSHVTANKMPAILELPQLSNYLDFRKFLADLYSYRREISKKDIRQYNYAMFSAAADIKSPNYLKMIIEGRRNLSEEMVYKFARAAGLPKDQTEEFRLLVLFGQATEPAQRNMYLKEINEYRVTSKLRTGEIDQKSFDKIPSWVTWVIFAMIDQEGVKFQPATLRELLRGKASFDEIEEALKSLISGGEVTVNAAGELERARNLMESAEDIPVALVRKLQSELMYLGLESLFRDLPTEREFGTLTLSLTKPEFEELRFQLRKIRKEAQKNTAVKRASSKGERVYQMNLQLFPVTDKA